MATRCPERHRHRAGFIRPSSLELCRYLSVCLPPTWPPRFVRLTAHIDAKRCLRNLSLATPEFEAIAPSVVRAMFLELCDRMSSLFCIPTTSVEVMRESRLLADVRALLVRATQAQVHIQYRRWIRGSMDQRSSSVSRSMVSHWIDSRLQTNLLCSTLLHHRCVCMRYCQVLASAPTLHLLLLHVCFGNRLLHPISMFRFRMCYQGVVIAIQACCAR